MTAARKPGRSDPVSKGEFEALARFRFGIRAYLRISEEMVRAHGVTPQQYQLMLALMGYPGREWATVQELADMIQLRHHSVVELINRAQKQGFVQRQPHPSDARAVRVSLTADGEERMSQLGALHRDELHRLGSAVSLVVAAEEKKPEAAETPPMPVDQEQGGRAAARPGQGAGSGAGRPRRGC